MKRTYIEDLKEHVGKEVKIAGWVDVRRDHGKLIFFDIRDMTGNVQAVVLPKHEKAHDSSKDLRSEWVIEIEGIVNKRPEKMVNEKTPLGDIELEITGIEVLSKSEELPFDKDTEMNLDTYLDHQPLTLRTDKAKAIFKVQATIVGAFREFLNKEKFTEFQSPKIIGEDAEGGASVFNIEYFDKQAHLAQSPQFYKQIMVGVYERAFCVGNVFRAEKHSTTRHLNEYTSLDLEMGFIKDHTDVMNIVDGLMDYITKQVEKKCKAELELLDYKKVKIPKVIPHMKLREAQEIIKKEYKEDCSGEPDLSPQHERWISEYALKKFKSDFVFITHYPTEKRPMYVYDDENDPGYTKSFDLLFRGIEVNTGGQRIHDYDELVSKMKKRKLDTEKFSFYLQAFKYGLPPHGGFGMGLERLTAKYLGLQNVKEATLFPREINRIDTLLS